MTKIVNVVLLIASLVCLCSFKEDEVVGLNGDMYDAKLVVRYEYECADGKTGDDCLKWVVKNGGKILGPTGFNPICVQGYLYTIENIDSKSMSYQIKAVNWVWVGPQKKCGNK